MEILQGKPNCVSCSQTKYIVSDALMVVPKGGKCGSRDTWRIVAQEAMPHVIELEEYANAS